MTTINPRATSLTIENQIKDGLALTLADVTFEWELFDHGAMQSHYIERLEDHHETNFQRERDPQGDPWVDLEESTVKAKGHDFILTEFDDLHQSLVSQTGDSIRRRTETDRGSELIYGTSDFKSGWHMTGTTNKDGSVRMPKREHVGIDDLFVDNIVSDTAEFLIESLKGKG